MEREDAWTKRELSLLREHYPSMGTDCIELLSERSRAAIKIKANELGIRSRKSGVTLARYFAADEERALFDDHRRGNKKAREQIIGSVMPMAKRYVRHRCKSDRFEDVLQAAYLGLCVAFDRFEPERGWRFSTFAMHWVRFEVSLALQSHGRSLITSRNQHIQGAVRAFLQSRCLATPEEVAERAKVTLEMATNVINAINNPPRGGFDMEVFHGESDVFDDAARAELAERVDAAIERAKLNYKEARVIKRRYLSDEDATLKEVGDEFGVSRERVRQIEEGVLVRLRGVLEQMGLAS